MSGVIDKKYNKPRDKQRTSYTLLASPLSPPSHTHPAAPAIHLLLQRCSTSSTSPTFQQIHSQPSGSCCEQGTDNQLTARHDPQQTDCCSACCPILSSFSPCSQPQIRHLVPAAVPPLYPRTMASQQGGSPTTERPTASSTAMTAVQSNPASCALQPTPPCLLNSCKSLDSPYIHTSAAANVDTPPPCQGMSLQTSHPHM
jgi:hypothetical protein